MENNKNCDDKNKIKKCGLWFNIFFTVFILYFSFVSWLLDDVKDSTQNITDLFGEFSLGMKYAIAFFTIFAIFVFGTIIIKMVWNRLIVKIFNTNSITTGEAYCIFLLPSFISLILL